MAEKSVEEIAEKDQNIYEAVVIMSRRARQVTDEQKILLDIEKETQPAMESRESEDFEDVEIDRDALNRDFIRLPKPSRVAIEEMIAGKLRFRYKEEEGQ